MSIPFRNGSSEPLRHDPPEEFMIRLIRGNRAVLHLCKLCVSLPILCLSLFCTAHGPPFPIQESTEPVTVSGRFRFKPTTEWYQNGIGEVYIEKSRKPLVTYFRMAIVGTNRAGALRYRLYEGKVFRTGKIIELRGDKCYLFGRKVWSDRSVPLERWDCDHLIFAFHPGPGGGLKGIQTERTAESDWFGPVDLIPLPQQGRAHFAGQSIGLTDNGQIVIYGYLASKLLRNGHPLHLTDETGRPVGTATVSERIGDIIFITPTKPLLSETGIIAQTGTTPRYGGVFE